MLGYFFESSEWILEIVILLGCFSYDLMCDCVHWEAIDAEKLLRYFLKDEMLLAAEQTLKKRERF